MTDFSFEGINFKVIDESLKTCSVGCGQSQTQTALIDTAITYIKIPSTAIKNDSGAEYTVTTISTYAFVHIYTIKTIIIPFTVEEIHHAAFAHDRSLVEVIFEPGSKLKVLGPRFIYSTLVSQIVLPQNIETIDQAAFEQTAYLKKIVFCGNIRISRLC